MRKCGCFCRVTLLEVVGYPASPSFHLRRTPAISQESDFKYLSKVVELVRSDKLNCNKGSLARRVVAANLIM